LAGDSLESPAFFSKPVLARDEVIETNVIGGRLVLVHRDVVPALYALRTTRLPPAGGLK
jgi:hypothetical protein